MESVIMGAINKTQVNMENMLLEQQTHSETNKGLKTNYTFCAAALPLLVKTPMDPRHSLHQPHST